MSEYTRNQKIGLAIARLRAESNITTAELADKSNLDQRRISQIEKGEFVASGDADVYRVLDALAELGVSRAKEFKGYIGRKWRHIEPPSFCNPERQCLENTEKTLDKITKFLKKDDHPWPLRRQIERQQELLLRDADFLGRVNHNIAFIGDIGVGKSTAISFIFDLLLPLSSAKKTINRPVLETGGGGTTICEVHIKDGSEVGISLSPMSDEDMRNHVSDFCAAKWVARTKSEMREAGETVNVSRELERAIRNMSGLVRKRQVVDGKSVYHDPVDDVVNSSNSEDEFETRVLELMNLDGRTRCEIRYNKTAKKRPMEWVAETFRAVNNGRLKDVPLPISICLLIPNFGQTFGELDITVIDTKGIDDVADREDLHKRLKDPWTAIVFCSRFNDAPGASTRKLLHNMREAFSERIDTGKVSLLALPRSEEACAMKNDMGGQAETDDEGYELKEMQVLSELKAKDLSGVPVLFYNVEIDDVEAIRGDLFKQLSEMRKAVEERLVKLCDASQDIMKNYKDHSLNAAIREVNNRLSTFLRGNRDLGAREQLAHVDAIKVIKDEAHASTLWASTRRNGDYGNLNMILLIGIGARIDANRRSESWFNGLDAFLRSLKADDGLISASQSIDQNATIAERSKSNFLNEVECAAVEVYGEPLSKASVWPECVSEWGLGPGFKVRVATHLEDWFSREVNLKDRLEKKINELWYKLVIMPLADADKTC